MSLIVAAGKEGLITASMKLGSFTIELFIEFLGHKVLPSLQCNQSQVFIMDNTKSHHLEITHDIIGKAGHSILYLPPYTPWFNITECIFTKFKPVVSHQDLTDHTMLKHFIYNTLSTLMAEDCQGWIRESKWWILIARHGYVLGEDHNAQDALAWHDLLPDERSMEVFNELYISTQSSFTEDAV
ncbi:uncharacterized protein SPSC_00101 [Sporisorium scitamineum]|uniref:Tc1-like transposase DDE domain-containing protein n=1 Tax=Sporisorium scitamineum TaxID=49012 RepID=A0A127Z7G5_9BASI|nr:uncharacterized protein SPSC_00101 [Sporisorium scitamineum]